MSLDTNETPRQLLGQKTSFRPAFFALATVSPADMPLTVCTSCPASLWRDQDGIICFCNVMKATTWTALMKPVTCCDGRETSLAKYEIEVSRLRKGE